MRTRLRYLLLLAVALPAVWLGLYPSIFTLGALIAAPLAIAALIGVASPSVLHRRRWLQRAVAIGSVLIGLEAALLSGWYLLGRRRPVLLITREPPPVRVRIVYGVNDGAPRSWFTWARQFEVPPSGIIHSQRDPDGGLYRPDNPHPLTAVARRTTGTTDTIVGAWVGGGSTQSGRCTLAFDEFALGDTAGWGVQSDASPPVAGWLDSLETWGVECRGDKLYRARADRPRDIMRTGSACYYNRDGGMSCSVKPAP